jgi:hypothetical protein
MPEALKSKCFSLAGRSYGQQGRAVIAKAIKQGINLSEILQTVEECIGQNDSARDLAYALWRPSNGTRLDPNWQPSAENVAYARTTGLTTPEIQRIAEKFKYYWLAKCGPNARKQNWDRAWNDWVLRALEWEGRAPRRFKC